MLAFLIILAIIGPIIVYRFEVAWNYSMHKMFPNITPVVKDIRDGQWILTVFSMFPPVFISILGCNLLVPISFNIKAKDFYWGFLFAKTGVNYSNTKLRIFKK